MGAQFAGHGSLHHVAALSGQSEAERSLARLVDAERSATTALAASIETLGRDHPGTAMASLALAAVRGDQARFDEARALVDDAERIGAAAGPAGARISTQAAALRDRYRLEASRPVPGTATLSP